MLSNNQSNNINITADEPVFPRGYRKQVERIQKVRKDQEEQRERQERQAKGESFNRDVLLKMRPPNFAQVQQKKLLLYVDVNITPKKTGRIGIYEGDDFAVLAKNFCKAFSLNKTMQGALEAHL